MALPRDTLKDKFQAICPNVYFQPPTNVSMVYPCIVYKRSKRRSKYADDKVYMDKKRYQVTVISRDADEPLVDIVSDFRFCSTDTSIQSDNLYHDVFTIYH